MRVSCDPVGLFRGSGTNFAFRWEVEAQATKQNQVFAWLPKAVTDRKTEVFMFVVMWISTDTPTVETASSSLRVETAD